MYSGRFDFFGEKEKYRSVFTTTAIHGLVRGGVDNLGHMDSADAVPKRIDGNAVFHAGVVNCLYESCCSSIRFATDV